MEGLITEGDQNCFLWYHRQLKETAETWFAKQKPVVEYIMANYFGNNVDEDVKNERKIASHEWTLRGDPFDVTSTINKRRADEKAGGRIHHGELLWE